MAMSPLLRLSPSSLREIAGALESGRLGSFSPLALAAWAAPEDRETLAGLFGDLHRGGLSGSALVLALRLLADQRTALAAASAPPELVWTGPKTSGSASRDTATVARQLFAKARRSVLVATFALYKGKSIFRVLAERMDEVPDLDVRLFLNVQRKPSAKAALAEDVLQNFAKRFQQKEWPGKRRPRVYYDPRALDPSQKAVLHAKCIVIDDSEAFISSANFTESAQERNIEAGVLVAVASVARALRRQFDTLVQNQELLGVPGLF
jgi:phosphatidylserine/phosphatidylglycerophosphate/cardiolipin synthase-like enzyme